MQLIIEGIRGKSYHGDIAIDDTSISDGDCGQVPDSSTTSSGCMALL